MKKQKYDLAPRIKDFLLAIGMSEHRLETLCGFSRRYLTNVNFVVPQEKYEKILSVLPQLNRNWLETGEGNMFNNLLRTTPFLQNNEDSLSMKYRAEIFNRIVVVMDASGFTVDTYEKITRIGKGTIHDVIFNADSPVVIAWVFDIMSGFPDYSIDWVLHGRGIRNISASNRFPLIAAEVASLALNDNDLPDNWLDIASNDDRMVMIPEVLAPEDHSLEKGFLFVVPALNRFYGGGAARPGDYLLCEATPTHPTNWHDGETYLIYTSGRIWCSKLKEQNGFRIEDPDVFTHNDHYVPQEAVVSLGHVVAQVHFTSYWAVEGSISYAKKLGLI